MTKADGVPVWCAHDEIADIDTLVENPRNPNTHPEKQLRLLAKIIFGDGETQGQGWRAPVTVSNRSGFIVRGHGRYLAARFAGKRKVPLDRQDYDSDEAEYADLIADNRIAELAEIDLTVLRDALEELDTGAFDMELTGFTEDDLLALMAPEGSELDNVEEVAAPDPPKKPITRRGDLIILGDHRLLCGDATKAEAYEKLMGGGTAEMLFTDPPWNVAIGKDANPKHRQREGLLNDDLPAEAFSAFISGFVAAMRRHLSGDAYCVLGASEWPTIDRALRAADYHWSATIIWAKDTFVLGRSKYHRRYEPIWYGWHKSGKSSFCDKRNLDDVWEIPRPKASKQHPTMKPIELCARAINNSSAAGSIVLDPFGGSGSTLIACEQLGRRCHTMELDPAYYDVIVSRWEEFTGKVAQRARSV